MNEQSNLAQVARLALRLGFTAFGGPAAHIAMLRDEVVTRRGWLSEQHFLDLLGITNLIPGPNSTEMVIHVGYERAGWKGLLAAGALFILPAATMTLIFAWLYKEYGATAQGEWLLYGIKPVIIAVVLQALYNLGKTALKNVPLAIIAAATLVLYLLGFNELVLLFGGALVWALPQLAAQLRRRVMALVPLALVPLPGVGWAAAEPYSLWQLFLSFLKIGGLLYGSGYVLLAFMRNDFVVRLGWLTDKQLLDAVAVGQFTPGPVFTTATFVGYLVGDVPGAALATLGIFLPAFVFVALVNPLIPKLRGSALISALLDGVNAAALGLMAAVTLTLGREALVDPLTVVLAISAAVLLLRFRVNSAWLVLGGGIVGIVAGLVHG